MNEVIEQYRPKLIKALRDRGLESSDDLRKIGGFTLRVRIGVPRSKSWPHKPKGDRIRVSWGLKNERKSLVRKAEDFDIYLVADKIAVEVNAMLAEQVRQQKEAAIHERMTAEGKRMKEAAGIKPSMPIHVTPGVRLIGYNVCLRGIPADLAQEALETGKRMIEEWEWNNGKIKAD